MPKREEESPEIELVVAPSNIPRVPLLVEERDEIDEEESPMEPTAILSETATSVLRLGVVDTPLTTVFERKTGPLRVSNITSLSVLVSSVGEIRTEPIR